MECEFDPIFPDFCFCLFWNISGRVMLIVVNVVIFSGSYLLIRL